MAKIHSTLITKSDIIPEDRLSIPIKKESIQHAVENKQNQLIITPPYSTAALGTLYNMNVYHKRCCLVKAGITVRLGFSLINTLKRQIVRKMMSIKKQRISLKLILKSFTIYNLIMKFLEMDMESWSGMGKVK